MVSQDNFIYKMNFVQMFFYVCVCVYTVHVYVDLPFSFEKHEKARRFKKLYELINNVVILLVITV